jgi:hypothetical protein
MAMQVAKTAQPYYMSKAKPKKNAGYLSWLHSLPCAATGVRGVQAAHISFASPWHAHTGRGKGTKAPDLFALPLSPAEHTRQHSMSEPAYWREIGIEPHQLAITLWAIYSMFDADEAAARAEARIYAGLAAAGRLRERALS